MADDIDTLFEDSAIAEMEYLIALGDGANAFELADLNASMMHTSVRLNRAIDRAVQGIDRQSTWL